MNASSARLLQVLCITLVISTSTARAAFKEASKETSKENVPDACDFIRQKIASLPLAGGQYRIPAGTYVCNKPIVLNQSHLTLSGDPGVVLKLADGANAPVIVMGDATTPPRALEDIEVSHLHIDGNRLHQTLECWGGPCDSGGTAFVRNNGISVRGLTNGRIQDVQITSARSGGVVTERGCAGLHIDSLTSVDNHFDGFAGYQTTGITVSNSRLANNQAAGISIDIDFNANTFRNVLIENNGDVGVFMRASNNNRFENVTIRGSGNHGLFLAQVENVQTCPIDNEFLNLAVSGSKGWGFRLNDACHGNRLTGTATFKGNRDGCISEGSTVPLEIAGVLQCEK